MKSVPLAEAKDKLSRLVDEAQTTHEIITITKHGRPAAVLMSADDLESLHDTLHWLSKPDLAEALKIAQGEIEAGDTVTGDELRKEYGLPPR